MYVALREMEVAAEEAELACAQAATSSADQSACTVAFLDAAEEIQQARLSVAAAGAGVAEERDVARAAVKKARQDRVSALESAAAEELACVQSGGGRGVHRRLQRRLGSRRGTPAGRRAQTQDHPQELGRRAQESMNESSHPRGCARVVRVTGSRQRLLVRVVAARATSSNNPSPSPSHRGSSRRKRTSPRPRARVPRPPRARTHPAAPPPYPATPRTTPAGAAPSPP